MSDNPVYDFPGLNLKWGQTLSGDVTGKLPKTTIVSKVNGVTFPANPTVGTVPYITSTNVITWTSPTTFDDTPLNRAPTYNFTINSNYSVMALRKFIIAANLKVAIKADGIMRIS